MAAVAARSPKQATQETPSVTTQPNSAANSASPQVNGHNSPGVAGGAGAALPRPPQPLPPRAPPPVAHHVSPPMSGSGSPAAPSQVATPPMSVHSHPVSHNYQQRQDPLPPHQTSMRMPTMHNGRVAIVEPPGHVARRSSGNGADVSFGSPTREHAPGVKFHEDLSRLTHAVQQSVPEAVRRVVRDNWEKTMLGSEYHQAFITNTAIRNANNFVVKRAIKDSGRKMVSDAKAEVIGHFTSADLDEVSSLILEKASDDFLDKALERRLGTIDARSLINALARAERLGYENSDAMDTRPDPLPMPAGPSPAAYAPVQSQQQLPQPMPAPSMSLYSSNTQESQSANHQAPRPAVSGLQCRLCWRKFDAAPPYEYHVKKQICTKLPTSPAGFPYSCDQCGTGFITVVGAQYHNANNVCGAHGTAAATPRKENTRKASPTMASGNDSPVITTPQQQHPQPQPHPPGLRPTYQAIPSPGVPQAQLPRETPIATPSAAHPRYVSYTPSSTPGAPPSSTPIADDPYGHLTPESRAKLDAELLDAEETYAPRFREADAIADPEERRKKLDSVQNTFSTRQSIIRKKFGVRLRKRRTKEEIDAERIRISEWSGTPSAKRQRTDDGNLSTPTWTKFQQSASSIPSASLRPPVTEPRPSKDTPVIPPTQSGSGGLNATTAKKSNVTPSDDTDARPVVPGRSLAAMQRSGYRISTHVSQHSPSVAASPTEKYPPKPQDPENVPIAVQGVAPTPAPLAAITQSISQAIETKRNILSPTAPGLHRGGSAAEPFVLEDDSSSTSDSDSEAGGDIPQHVPPSRKTSGGL